MSDLMVDHLRARALFGFIGMAALSVCKPAIAGEVPPLLPSAPPAAIQPAPLPAPAPSYGLAAADLPLAPVAAALPLPRVPLVDATAGRPTPGPVAAPTLADAVRMVRAGTAATMNADMQCLATAIYFESKGEPLDGQLAVAQVILNRVASPRFGGSVCDVVKAPRQFSFVRGGRLGRPTNETQFGTARAIAWIAMKDAWNRIVGSATHFHALTVRPGWKLQRIAAIGNHIFYR
jgi:hypothetical protein